MVKNISLFIKERLKEFDNNIIYLSKIADIASQLYDIDEVKFVMMLLYDIDMDETEINDYEGKQIIRIDQQLFTNELKKRYGGCVITGIKTIVNGCHVVPYNICKNYKLDNGILLTPDLHALFDKNYFTISNETFEVIISDRMKEDPICYEQYKKYNGKILELKGCEIQKYLAEHNATFRENI